MATLEELKTEADNLGITYAPKIGAEKLQAKIDAHYESQAADDLVQETAEETPVEDTNKLDAIPVNSSPAQKRAKNMREIAAEMRTAAMKTRVVRLSNNDKRDSHVTTTAYLSMENQYFGLSKIVPLDIPIELEQCLIDVAKNVEIILHVDEIIDGKRTGNKRPQYVKKYVVSYEDMAV